SGPFADSSGTGAEARLRAASKAARRVMCLSAHIKPISSVNRLKTRKQANTYRNSTVALPCLDRSGFIGGSSNREWLYRYRLLALCRAAHSGTSLAASALRLQDRIQLRAGNSP